MDMIARLPRFRGHMLLEDPQGRGNDLLIDPAWGGESRAGEQLGLEAGLFLYLAQSRLGGILVRFHVPAREHPAAKARVLDEPELPPVRCRREQEDAGRGVLYRHERDPIYHYTESQHPAASCEEKRIGVRAPRSLRCRLGGTPGHHRV